MIATVLPISIACIIANKTFRATKKLNQKKID